MVYSITVKPRFTAEFGGKEISAVNRGSREIGVLFVYIIHVKDNSGERRWPRYIGV